MRRLATALLVVCTGTAAGQEATDQNWLTNPGFEEAQPAKPTAAQGWSDDESFERVRDSHSGEWAYKSKNGWFIARVLDVPHVAGKTVTVSAWANSEQAVLIRLSTVCEDSQSKNVELRQTAGSGSLVSSDWQFFYSTWLIPDKATRLTRFYIHVSPREGMPWELIWDDCRLHQGMPSKAELASACPSRFVANPGFEAVWPGTGDLAGRRVPAEWHLKGDFTVVMDGHTGDAALRLTGSSALAWTATEGWYSLGDSECTLSCYARSPDGGRVNLALLYKLPDGTTGRVESGPLTLEREWRAYSFTAIFPPETGPATTVRIAASSPNGRLVTVDVDDLDVRVRSAQLE